MSRLRKSRPSCPGLFAEKVIEWLYWDIPQFGVLRSRTLLARAEALSCYANVASRFLALRPTVVSKLFTPDGEFGCATLSVTRNVLRWLRNIFSCGPIHPSHLRLRASFYACGHYDMNLIRTHFMGHSTSTVLHGVFLVPPAAGRRRENLLRFTIGDH